MTLASVLSVLGVAAGLILSSPAGAAGSDGLKAWIEPINRDGIVEFHGYVSAPEPMSVNYQIRIVRISAGGRAATSQGGQVQIAEPNEPTALSVTAIKVGRGDSYEVELVATGPSGEEVRVGMGKQ